MVAGFCKPLFSLSDQDGSGVVAGVPWVATVSAGGGVGAATGDGTIVSGVGVGEAGKPRDRSWGCVEVKEIGFFLGATY